MRGHLGNAEAVPSVNTATHCTTWLAHLGCSHAGQLPGCYRRKARRACKSWDERHQLRITWRRWLLGFAWCDARARCDASSRQRVRRDVRRQAPPLHVHLVARVWPQAGVVLAAADGGNDSLRLISCKMPV